MANWLAQSAIGTDLALAGVAASALHDVAVRTVPNRYAAFVATAAFIQAAAEQRFMSAVAVAAALFAFGWLLWLRGWLGGGDVKLLAAAAPLIAPSQVLALLLATALAGGILALAYAPGRRVFARPAPIGPLPPRSGQGRATRLLARLIRCERWRLSRRGPLPYAVAIAVGLTLVLIREH